MAAVADLLRERERRGLRGALIARILVLLLSAGIAAVSAGTVLDLVLSIGILVAAAACAGLLLRMLDRAIAATRVGVAAVGIDMVVVTALPLIWLTSVGGPDMMPLSFTVKGNLATVMMLIIVLNAVPLRPLYPVIASAGSAAVYLGFVVAAVADPRTEFTRDFALSVMGPPLSIGGTMANVALIVLIGGLAGLTTLLARRLTLSGAQLEKANAQLGRYFSPAVRDEISDASDAFLEPGGEERVITVLFCDIRNFTRMSAAMSPQEVMSFLSEYHSRMVDAVFAHGGTLDKFIGDAVMATFGTPRPVPDDAERAVRAGIAMRQALDEFNRERAAKGIAEVHHGVGIHSGRAVVGNVGTRERLEYTVIGDTVNVASRIAAVCKTTGEDLLISETVRARLDGAYNLRPIKPVELAGKSEPVALFAVEGA